MLQALSRYCPQCNTPTPADLQRCATCNLPVEALPHSTDQKQFETDASTDAALLSAMAPTPRRFQPVDEEAQSDCQPACDVPDEFFYPPRFSPASPLPPEPEEQDARDNQERLQRWPAQQEPRFPTSPLQLWPLLSSEPWHGPVLAPLSDTSASPPVEVQIHRADQKQFETDTSIDTTPQSASAPIPRRFQPVDEEILSDYQLDCDTPDELPQPSHPSPASPLPPEPGKRNTHRGRRRTGTILIILAALLILAGGSYIAFSDYLPGLNSSQATPSVNSAINIRATAAAKAANANPYTSGGTLIFSDALKTASANWDQNKGCAFKNGSYHVTTITIQSCSLNANVTLTNFVLEAKVTLLQGNVGGFFFRENKLHNRSNAYLIDFDSKGNYQFWNYSVSGPAKLIDYGFSSNLSAGYNQTNRIALVVQKSSITLYINGQMIKHFIDSTYNSGGLSLISSEYAPRTGVSEAAYSDLRLWQL